MDFIFRQMTIIDQPTVLNIFKTAAERIGEMQVDHWQYWKDPPAEKLAWVAEGIRNKEFFFIEDTDGTRIGMVRIMQEDQLYWGVQKEKARYVHSLVVNETFAGQGLGRKILEQIAEGGKEEQCEFIRLDADAKNTNLCRYYERLQFKKVGNKIRPLSTYNLYQRPIY